MDAVGKSLLQLLRKHFALDWQGIHGAPHWSRVHANGMRLASATGANVRVVEAFAFLHDSCRQNEGTDHGHGARAAAFARRLNGSELRLDAGELELLATACAGHSNGGLEGDITVCTCWDADRLDLGRVGIRPDPRYLCTKAARDRAMIEWAYQRSVRGA